MTKLLLFDIDGTLVKSGSELVKLEKLSYTYAFKEIYGLDASIEEVEYWGKTTRQVITEVLKLKDIEDHLISSGIDRIIKVMADYFKENAVKLDAGKDLIEGAAGCLKELTGNGGYVLGLATGNIKEIARAKLEKFGLWDHFQVGGFGDKAEDRWRLVEYAMEQTVQKLGLEIDKNDVYVIGDTKFDISSAKQNGVKSIAVTTGGNSKRYLETFCPDYVIDSLSELPELLKHD